MIAVDTNILVRYFTLDDPGQAPAAARFLEETATPENPAFVSLVTLVELIWVLADVYGVGNAVQDEIVSRMLEAPNIVIDQEPLVRSALATPHGDMSDRIIHALGVANGCSHTVTFDRKFTRLDGVELLK